MALSDCLSQVDVLGRELTVHGSRGFPIGCYYDDLRKEEVPWHWHEELEAAVVTQGETILHVEKQQILLHSGDGFFINSGYLHACDYAGSGPCRFHSMSFHARLVGGEEHSVFWEKYLDPLLDRPDLKFRVLRGANAEDGRLLEQIEGAWQACLREEPGYEFAVRERLSRLLLALSQTTDTAGGSGKKAGYSDWRVKKMLAFMEEHFAERISAEEIAASVGLSTSECLRLFHQTLDTTPIKYLNRLRVRKAAHLLSSSDRKIIDIGIECGFQDMSYFARVFAREKGATPREYRKFSRRTHAAEQEEQENK